MHYFLYAFGSNGESQLGLGFTSDGEHAPTLVPAPPPRDNMSIRKICGGGNHTLVLADNDKVYVAGLNTDGQLGHMLTQRPSNRHAAHDERLIKFDKRYRDISFCAATETTSAYILNGCSKQNKSPTPILYTEGRGRLGELGRGEMDKTKDQFTINVFDKDTLSTPLAQFENLGIVNTHINTHPEGFKFPRQVVDFAGGTWHYAAVLDNGDVWGWGKNRNGQLGPSQSETLIYPTNLLGIPFEADRVVCGKEFTYIVGRKNEGFHCILGSNKFRENMPDCVPHWKDIGATWNAVFVLFEDGSLIAFGTERQWNLIPPNLPSIDQIAIGNSHVLALTAAGKLISWGWGSHGNCGYLDPIKFPEGIVSGTFHEIQSSPPGDIRKIWAGASTSFVLTSCESPSVGELYPESDNDAKQDIEKDVAESQTMDV
ncbi:RCC1/BLIP-II [Lindgomyces ingoldianus]|uniref:RCC1/BLIP-II n=1 Tax=Lindgomyces ingoldianus TaxID=673940 RepID=A0ACB6R4W6_9PLEO|nr:RCC1/BLIP-II [Lindgomyces ingoldianus]KAF2473332.1 RCC1/BLIP-II [Lindgomyces ingoldianus]